MRGDREERRQQRRGERARRPQGRVKNDRTDEWRSEDATCLLILISVTSSPSVSLARSLTPTEKTDENLFPVACCEGKLCDNAPNHKQSRY